MYIEERLESIDTSLKTIITILQSAGAITAVAGTPEAPAAAAPAVETKPKAARKAKDEPAAQQDLVAGDPQGTRYWVSDEAKQVYAQKPGDPDPQDQTFKIESSTHYLTKKAEFAKNAPPAAEPQPAATTEPSATAQPDTASADWDTVFREIKALSTDPKGGREAVLGVLKHFGCEGKTVPALKDLGKNAEILAHVKGLLAPAADDLGL